MNRIRLRWPSVGRLSVFAVAVFTLPLVGQQPDVDKTKKEVVEPPVVNVVKNSAPVTTSRGAREDETKTGYEAPAEKVVRDSAPATLAKPVIPDGGKRVLEFPTKRVVGASSSNATAAKAASDPANPTVKAGEVTWHPSFAKACAAAKTSGKPVLLFHMMGHLDKQFC